MAESVNVQMRLNRHLLVSVIACAGGVTLLAQAPPVMVNAPQVPASPQQPQQVNPQQQQQANPQAAQPGQPAPAAQNPPAQINRLSGSQPFLLGAVSLTEMIDVLAKEMKINYILD